MTVYHNTGISCEQAYKHDKNKYSKNLLFFFILRLAKHGKVRLTKLVLKKLAKDLRRNGSLARRAVRRLESLTGGRVSANKITAVIEGVAARLDRYETATCNFFANVASRFGISRWIGYKICQLAIYLLL